MFARVFFLPTWSLFSTPCLALPEKSTSPSNIFSLNRPKAGPPPCLQKMKGKETATRRHNLGVYKQRASGQSRRTTRKTLIVLKSFSSRFLGERTGRSRDFEDIWSDDKSSWRQPFLLLLPFWSLASQIDREKDRKSTVLLAVVFSFPFLLIMFLLIANVCSWEKEK